jgi:hypothetical protein
MEQAHRKGRPEYVELANRRLLNPAGEPPNSLLRKRLPEIVDETLRVAPGWPLAVSFHQVVHPVLTEEAEVAKLQCPRGTG